MYSIDFYLQPLERIECKLSNPRDIIDGQTLSFPSKWSRKYFYSGGKCKFRFFLNCAEKLDWKEFVCHLHMTTCNIYYHFSIFFQTICARNWTNISSPNWPTNLFWHIWAASWACYERGKRQPSAFWARALSLADPSSDFRHSRMPAPHLAASPASFEPPWFPRKSISVYVQRTHSLV